MSEPAKHIQIRRERGLYGVFRKLKIKVDGAELLGIKSGETLAVKLPPGARELTMQMDWISTDALDLAEVLSDDTLVIYVQRRSFHQMSSVKDIPFGIRIERN